MTKTKLELIPDSDMYLFFEKVREVEFLIFLIDIVKPAASIPNLMTQSKKRNIIYLDVNDLYGYAMSKFLSTSGFK